MAGQRSPDGGALGVTLTCEHRCPCGRIEGGLRTVPVNDKLGSPVDVEGIGRLPIYSNSRWYYA
jgi:hypothetical protein